MASLALFLLSSALSATPLPATPRAVIQFDPDAPLRGISYGFDAVDGQRMAFGDRTRAQVAPGLRTIWYSCPNSPQPVGGNRLSFEFEADKVYALQCRAGQPAVVVASGC